MKTLKTLLGVAILLGTASCLVHEVTTPTSQEYRIAFNVATPGDFLVSQQSRSLTEAQEKAIEEIAVLIFDNKGVLTYIRYAQTIEQTATGNEFSISIPREITGTQIFNFVVIANDSSLIKTVLGNEPNDQTFTAVAAALVERITGAMYTNGGIIPMWGQTGNKAVTTEGLNLDVKLTRAVARIDVGVGANAVQWNGIDAEGRIIPFQLREVYVARPNDRYGLVPTASPSIPAGTVSFSAADSWNKFKYNVSGGLSTSRDIYVPEAKLAGTGTSGDASHTNRMAIVVGGRYDNSSTTTYYRIDFLEQGEFVDILRNHLYRFSITAVTGPGQATPQQAYESSANMSAELLDWEDGLLEYIVFGNYYLAVSQNPAELPAEQDETLVVKISTDASRFDLMLGGASNASLSSDTATAAGAAGQTYQTTYFDYTLRKEAAEDEYSLTVVTREDNISEMEVSKIDHWRINAGGAIQMPFEVSQKWQPEPPTLEPVEDDIPAGGGGEETDIPADGGIYTIEVATNLDSWGVKVYRGDKSDPQPTGFPIVEHYVAPQTRADVKSISIAIPPADEQTQRTLSFYVFSDLLPVVSSEILVKTTAQAPMPAPPVEGGQDDILYLDANGRLSVGKFSDGTVNISNLLLFKFGSVIGFNANEPSGNFALDDILFNPSALVVGTDITAYYDPATYGDILPGIPAFVPADYTTGGIRNISEDSYHNAANIRTGKGDPCRLVGLAANKVNELSHSELNNHRSGWRMPTAKEQANFIGGEPGGAWESWQPGTTYNGPINASYPYYDHATSGATGTANDPHTGSFPVVDCFQSQYSSVLPATGYVFYGIYNSDFRAGEYWSSTLYDNNNAYRLSFDASRVFLDQHQFFYGFAVRCIRE